MMGWRRCCICGEVITGMYAGHNAKPVADGRCCDLCNTLSVIPTRLRIAVLTKHKLQTKAIFSAKAKEEHHEDD